MCTAVECEPLTGIFLFINACATQVRYCGRCNSCNCDPCWNDQPKLWRRHVKTTPWSLFTSTPMQRLIPSVELNRLGPSFRSMSWTVYVFYLTKRVAANWPIDPSQAIYSPVLSEYMSSLPLDSRAARDTRTAAFGVPQGPVLVATCAACIICICMIVEWQCVNPLTDAPEQRIKSTWWRI